MGSDLCYLKEKGNITHENKKDYSPYHYFYLTLGNSGCANNSKPVFMPPSIGQIFVIDYTKADGSVTRTYYRSDGSEWDGSPVTKEFKIE